MIAVFVLYLWIGGHPQAALAFNSQQACWVEADALKAQGAQPECRIAELASVIGGSALAPTSSVYPRVRP